MHRNVWNGAMWSVTALMALSAGTAMAAGPQDRARADEIQVDAERGYPFLDARLDSRELPTAATKAALARAMTKPAWAAREADAAALRAMVPGVRMDTHASLGSFASIVSTQSFLTGPSKQAPKDVARGWIAQHEALLGVTLGQVDKWPMSADFVTSEGLMNHFTWQQTIGEIELFGSEIRANVTGKGELINAGSTAIPTDGIVIAAPVLSDLDAIRAAAANVGVDIKTNPTPGEATGANQARAWQAGPDLGNQDHLETRLVYFPTSRDTIVPAWSVLLPVKGVGHVYEMVVDATNGQILWRWDRLQWDNTQPATYRVFTSDSPGPMSPGRNTPDGVQAPIVARTLLTVTPAEIAPFSPGGWIPDGANTTAGNNVHAYTDAANDNTESPADLATGTAAPARVFDFAQNLTTDAPSVYRDAAITQLFYFGNRFHDRLFALGFDEAARNFQTTNFVTGTGGDAVLAEAQDGSGTNNANFSSGGADGGVGRCQMYVWTGPTPDRDGDLDGDIVYHEFGHGLSIRLHRGNLTGTQGGGMGEGWSDYFALSLNAEASDDFSAVYAAGAYATLNITTGFTNNYYFGIRRYPYSADLAKSPLTYADIDVFTETTGAPRGPIGSATPNEVHNIGEIWCQVLLECRREIALTEGFAANQIMMQLAVDGMKLATAAPSCLQERDWIIAADNARYGGAHNLALWRGFAKRGMGVSATSPSGGATAGIVEAFDLPVRVDYSYPSGTPTVFSPSTPTNITVTMNPVLLTLTPNTQRLFYSINGGAFTSVPMTSLGANQYRAAVPAEPCLSTIRYYVQTGTSSGNNVNPTGAPANFYSGDVRTSTNTYFADDMEINRGWTAGQPGDTATTGIWNRMDPQGTAAQPEDDVSAAGTICWVTDGNAGTGVGAFDVDGGFTTLLSPALPLAGHPDAVISYYRWYSNNQGGAPNADTFRVEISANGSTNWLPFETVGPTAESGGGWIFHSARVGNFITPTNTTRLRFIADDAGTGSVVEAALDEFSVTEAICVAPPSCDPDLNQDGNADQDDVAYLINVIGGGSNPAGIDPDFNHDGNADQDDISALITVIAGGACP